MEKNKNKFENLNLPLIFLGIGLVFGSLIFASVIWYMIFSVEYRGLMGSPLWQVPALALAFGLSAFAVFEWAGLADKKHATSLVALLLFGLFAGSMAVGIMDQNHAHARQVVSWFAPWRGSEIVVGQLYEVKTPSRVSLYAQNGERVELYAPEDTGIKFDRMMEGRKVRVYGQWVEDRFLATKSFLE